MKCQFSSGLLNIAHAINGRNIIIVFDVSGSMYPLLDFVKTSIYKLVHIWKTNFFNVISSATTKNLFSDYLVSYTKENLFSLSSWLSSQQCESQTNVLLALLAAFSNENCDSVILFTDGYLNQKPAAVSKCIKELSGECPLHTVYVNKDLLLDTNVIKFWEELAIETDGTLHTLTYIDKNIVNQCQLYPKSTEKYQSIASSECSSESSISVNSSFVSSESHRNLMYRKKIKNGFKYHDPANAVRTGWDCICDKQEPSKKLQNILDNKEIGEILCSCNNEVSNNDISNKKINENDYVLVNINDKKFLPGKVIKKDYEFDSRNDSLDFQTQLTVKLINGKKVVVPMEAAVLISFDVYEEIAKSDAHDQLEEVHRRDCIHAGNNIKPINAVAYYCPEFDVQSHRYREVKEEERKSKKDYLKEKIEQQLAESAEYLQRLGLNDYADTVEQYMFGYGNQTGQNWKLSNARLSRSLNIPKQQFHEDPSENTSLMSAYPSTKEPHPPNIKSWKSKDKNEKVRKSRRRIRSVSVGSNAVERSRKHWLGRPISKEIAPKRQFNERVRVIPSKANLPLAEEYQTADGIPFPSKTDRKFHPRQNGNWLPDNHLPGPPYQHCDIIGHRVVDFPDAHPNSVNAGDKKKKEIREKNRINALQNNCVIRERREQEKKRSLEEQMKERDEQARQQQKEREEEGYSRVQITIEKDRSRLEDKQRRYIAHRLFERDREQNNQQKKNDRIDAMKERKQNYPQLNSNYGKPQPCQNVPREEKRKAVEQNRIEKEIQVQEEKLNRLRRLRKSTDARMDASKRRNNQHRDINEHVKSLNQGRARAEILP